MRLVALIATAGCYHSGAPAAGDAGFDASATGSDAADAAAGSDATQPPHCTPSSTGLSMAIAGSVATATLSTTNATYALVGLSGGAPSIGLVQSVTTVGTPTPLPVLAGYAHPALIADGRTMFLSDPSNNSVQIATSSGTDPTQWILTGPAAGLTDVLPTTPVRGPDGKLHMVTADGQSFRELVADTAAGPWTSTETAAGYAVLDPSLSSDGRLLVFVAIDVENVNTGIYYAERPTIGQAFTVPSLGTQLVVTGKFATPVLSDDCTQLFAVTGTELVVYQ